MPFPERRLAAPVLPHLDDVFFICTGLNGGLDLVVPSGRRPLSVQESNAVIDASVKGTRVVVDTLATAKLMASACPVPSMSKWFELAATISMGTRVVVAHTALDAMFNHPNGGATERLGEWMAPLEMESSNPWPVVAHITSGKASNRQMYYNKHLEKVQESIATSMTRYPLTSSTMNSLYTKVDQAKNCADGYLCLDVIYGHEMVANGESVIVDVMTVQPDRVVARLSSPCKVRIGPLLLIDDDGNSPGQVDLVRIGWDQSSSSITGVLARPEKGVRGFEALVRAGKRSWRVAPNPMTGAAPERGGSWWAEPNTAASVVARLGRDVSSPGAYRDVPVDLYQLAWGAQQ